MTPPLWQILCVTLASRRHFLDRLREKLCPQLTDDVEFLTLEDNGERSIGFKRQEMLEDSSAPWLSFIDDDDLPSDDFVARIRPVLIEGACDVVGFKQLMMKDGQPRQMNILSWRGNEITMQLPRGMSRGNRWPNHLCPVRREIALRVGFLDRNTGEDSAYTQGLCHLRPQPREQFIDAELYVYDYRSTGRRPAEEVQSTNEYRRKHEPAVAR